MSDVFEMTGFEGIYMTRHDKTSEDDENLGFLD